MVSHHIRTPKKVKPHTAPIIRAAEKESPFADQKISNIASNDAIHMFESGKPLSRSKPPRIADNRLMMTLGGEPNECRELSLNISLSL